MFMAHHDAQRTKTDAWAHHASWIAPTPTEPLFQTIRCSMTSSSTLFQLLQKPHMWQEEPCEGIWGLRLSRTHRRSRNSFNSPVLGRGHELAQRQNELSGFSQLILCPMCNKRIPTTPWCLSTFLCVACSELPLQEARVRRRRFGLAARLFVQMIGPLWGEPVSLALGVHCHRTSGFGIPTTFWGFG